MINAIKFYRIARFFYKRKIPFVPDLIKAIIFIIYNSSIPYECIIGKGSFFAYGGIGVVLHKRAKIGRNVVIGSNVTIGGKSGKWDVPVIADNVYISTGAKILGNVYVGEFVVIGANAVVIKDIPPNAVVAGIPAKILSFKGGPEYFDNNFL